MDRPDANVLPISGRDLHVNQKHIHLLTTACMGKIILLALTETIMMDLVHFIVIVFFIKLEFTDVEKNRLTMGYDVQRDETASTTR